MLVSNKEKYIHFCAEQPDIPIFSQPWWLDTVCPDNWDVILIEKKDKIIASFPYYKRKIKKIFTHLGMPQLTQKLGPYIVYDSNKITENKKIEYEHEIYNEIIEKLPKYDNLEINFDWKYKNWLPFYWKGYKQTTRYTYIIANIENNNYTFAHGKAQNVQKAKKLLTFHFDLPKEVFYSYFYEAVNERNDTVSFSINLFYLIFDTLYEHNAGRSFYCVDAKNNIHAINLTIWDKECAYYLIAMRKNDYNASGGTEFLVDETIKYVSQFVNRFDFEGSMIKGVEAAYRYYGAHQTEYYSISKCNNPVLRVLKAIRNS